MGKLNLKPGLRIGDGARTFEIEKITKEIIYVRGIQDNKPLRYIPVFLIDTLLKALNEHKISIQDISREYRTNNQLPHLFDELQLNLDKYILGYDSTIKKICEYLLENPSTNKTNKNTYTFIHLSKPFLLLAGISGTGKTRFVREQAKAHQQFTETYCLTSVRPDWHEPSDLLGYISRLNGQAEYITTDVLKFIAKAWRALIDAGLTVEIQNIDEQGERLVVAGERDALNAILPYWLCLDEMNLAPVEQYFADYLSVLETREWQWDEDAFIYMCDPLLKPATIEDVADKEHLKNALGFADAKYRDAWKLICQHGLGIPFNLMVAGTVNMDETTHSFSRKVIDRALSFDFGEFFPNDYAHFFAPNSHNKILSYPICSHAHKEDLAGTYDTEGQKSTDFLSAVNAALTNTPFKLAYRALNELLLAVISQNPQDELTLKAIWDDFLMCKVLPRIEGDRDKLTCNAQRLTNVDSDHLDNRDSLLEQLSQLLQTRFGQEFWDGEIRPDLYREKKDDNDKVIRIACRSKAKLAWMQNRLSSASFTSFWP